MHSTDSEHCASNEDSSFHQNASTYDNVPILEVSGITYEIMVVTCA